MSMTKGRRGFLQRLMGTVGVGAAASAASSDARRPERFAAHRPPQRRAPGLRPRAELPLAQGVHLRPLRRQCRRPARSRPARPSTSSTSPAQASSLTSGSPSPPIAITTSRNSSCAAIGTARKAQHRDARWRFLRPEPGRLRELRKRLDRLLAGQIAEQLLRHAVPQGRALHHHQRRPHRVGAFYSNIDFVALD